MGHQPDCLTASPNPRYEESALMQSCDRVVPGGVASDHDPTRSMPRFWSFQSEFLSKLNGNRAAETYPAARCEIGSSLRLRILPMDAVALGTIGHAPASQSTGSMSHDGRLDGRPSDTTMTKH